jgi:hypothetical protein
LWSSDQLERPEFARPATGRNTDLHTNWYRFPGHGIDTNTNIHVCSGYTLNDW